MNTTSIQHAQYSIVQQDGINPNEAAAGAQTLMMTWVHEPGLSAYEFAAGIRQFARQCAELHPERAVIDARQLDQSCEGVTWLRGQADVDGLADYEPWWAQTAVPLYREAGISWLVVATGDPNAPGEIPAPPKVSFRIGYVTDLEQALAWDGTS